MTRRSLEETKKDIYPAHHFLETNVVPPSVCKTADGKVAQTHVPKHGRRLLAGQHGITLLTGLWFSWNQPEDILHQLKRDLSIYKKQANSSHILRYSATMKCNRLDFHHQNCNCHIFSCNEISCHITNYFYSNR